MVSYFIVALFQCATFTINFLSKLKSQFQVIFGKIPFLWKWVHFRSVFRRTLRTVSLLMNGGIPAFTNTLFLQKIFPISSCKRLVCCKIFLFVEQTVLVVFPDYSFVTTKSQIFFFICLKMVAFEYFQYDLIFDISEKVFPASWCR